MILRVYNNNLENYSRDCKTRRKCVLRFLLCSKRVQSAVGGRDELIRVIIKARLRLPSARTSRQKSLPMLSRLNVAAGFFVWSVIIARIIPNLEICYTQGVKHEVGVGVPKEVNLAMGKHAGRAARLTPRAHADSRPTWCPRHEMR